MDETIDISRMKREIQPVPDYVTAALEENGLVKAYQAQPAYQQNDYVGWITGCKRLSTRQKRLDQMLDELERGGAYMKMKWNG